MKGDELTSEEHTELMNKVGNSYPINKYVFTFMNAEDSKGTVDLYYSDNNMKTGNFEKEHIVLDEENAIPIKGEYKLSEYYRITIKEIMAKLLILSILPRTFYHSSIQE